MLIHTGQLSFEREITSWEIHSSKEITITFVDKDELPFGQI